MYKAPKDPAAFDRHYFATHVPIAQRIPGLGKYEVSQGAVASPGGASGIHLVAILHFDDMAAVGRAFASDEGKAVVADVGKFATGGVDILMFDQREV